MRKAIIIALFFALTGCAQHYAWDFVSDPYGFFYGIWHGLVSPFAAFINIASWILSLIGFSFMDDIQIIGQPNTGFFYYVGFLFGLSSSIATTNSNS